MFKVGDKVTLREGLVVDQMYGELTLLSRMYKDTHGKVLTVREVSDSGRIFKVEGSFFCYSAKMFKHASIWTDKLEAEKELELLLEKYAA